jgi:hypothetical protein
MVHEVSPVLLRMPPPTLLTQRQKKPDYKGISNCNTKLMLTFAVVWLCGMAAHKNQHQAQCIK